MSELDDSFAVAQSLLHRLHEQYEAGQLNAEALRITLIGVVGALRAHGRPPRTSDKPERGLGYGQSGKPEIRPDGSVVTFTTPDDAMIVASLPWFKGNMSAAIRAHYPEADDAEKVRVHARRIREHQREIAEAIGKDHPWETSDNWLGDLPRE